MSSVATVAAYLRISEDPDDLRAGVDRQRQDCEAEAKRRGWGEVDVWFTDNDVSAWRKTVTRHAWRDMLAQIDAGAVDRVVVYDLDRLVRQPRDLEDLIDLADDGKVRVAGVSSEIDLTTDAGVTMARVLTAMAWKSSADTARRVARQKRARAEQGRGPGARYRAFGYTRTYEIEPNEAEIVRDLFKRAAAGETLQALSNDLNARGIPTTAGKQWRRTTLANLIARPGYAGIATHKGERVGATSYPAIVDEAVWEAAQQEPHTPGFNTRQYLLSGIATCGVCHSPMYGTRNSGGRYACKPGRPGSCASVTIKGTWLDTAMLIALTRQLVDDAERGDVRDDARDYGAEIVAIDKRIAELRDAHNQGALELADLVPMLKAERAKRAALVREQAVVVADKSAAELAASSLEELLAAPLSLLRAQVQRNWQAVVVKPTTAAGRRRFDPERISLLWADGRETDWAFDVTPEQFDAFTSTYAALAT